MDGRLPSGVRRILETELSVSSHMGQLTGLGAAERQAAEDKRPRMEGEILFALVALFAGKVDRFELTKPAFRHRDGGKNMGGLWLKWGSK